MLHHTPEGRPYPGLVLAMGGASLVPWHVPKHKARARVGQVGINTSEMVLKSLHSVDLFGRLWRGAS